MKCVKTLACCIDNSATLILARVGGSRLSSILSFQTLFSINSDVNGADTIFFPGIYPWSVKTYEQGIPARHGPLISWTRNGKIWSEEEVEELLQRFEDVWTEVYREKEEAITHGHPSGHPMVIVTSGKALPDCL